MKSKLVLLCIVTIVSLNVYSQFVVSNSQSQASSDGKEGVGRLLKILAEAIKPNAYLNTYSKQKTSFLSTTQNTADATGMAASVALLATYIKPDNFKTGITKNTVMAAASAVTSMSQAKGLLKNFETWLKPDAVNSIWKLQRNGWINEIELIK